MPLSFYDFSRFSFIHFPLLACHFPILFIAVYWDSVALAVFQFDKVKMAIGDAYAIFNHFY